MEPSGPLVPSGRRGGRGSLPGLTTRATFGAGRWAGAASAFGGSGTTGGPTSAGSGGSSLGFSGLNFGPRSTLGVAGPGSPAAAKLIATLGFAVIATLVDIVADGPAVALSELSALIPAEPSLPICPRTTPGPYLTA